MTNSLDAFTRIGATDHFLAVVAVSRPDGSVQTSLVNAGVLDHPLSGEPVVGLVVQGGAAKLRLLRRIGRASLTVYRDWQWSSVEGPAELIGPDDSPKGDAVDHIDLPALLRAIFTAAGGTHDAWDTYDRVMAEERRTAVLVHPERVTGTG